MLTEMIDFTSHGIKKRKQSKKALSPVNDRRNKREVGRGEMPEAYRNLQW